MKQLIEVEPRYGPHGRVMTAYLEVEREWHDILNREIRSVYPVPETVERQFKIWMDTLWLKLSDDEHQWLNERRFVEVDDGCV